MKTLIIGNGGRESSLAMRLAEDSSVFAVMKHLNPTIIKHVEQTGGGYLIGDTNDGKLISSYAKEKNIDLAIVSSDEPLEAGVVNSLLEYKIRTVGPTRVGAEIEWNKTFAMTLMHEIIPEFTPRFWIVEDENSLKKTFDQVIGEDIPIVVKPQGLTGGKGVKVMGEHLQGFDDAKKYSLEILTKKIGKSTSVVIEEKLTGIEYTIQAITDGKSVICPPASYDHPYLFDFDKGPGTGGMGAFTDRSLSLPFMSQQDYKTSVYITEQIIEALKEKGRHFNGVLNAGFFLTKQGVKVMEFNARFGDPECMNIMTILDSSLLHILEDIYTQTLNPQNIKFKDKASVVKYLVAPEYAISEGKPHTFFIDVSKIELQGVNVFFSSAIKTDKLNMYQTVGNSRNVALAAIADTIPEASIMIDESIQKYFKGPLQYRRDIGTLQEINDLKQKMDILREK